MVQYSISPLDVSFAALSDATRRGIIHQLGRADESITSLAADFNMTLTGMKKHVQVLERAGLVVTEKVGRVRTCKLGERGLQAEAEWIEVHRKLFEERFNALDEIISELNQEESDGSADLRCRYSREPHIS
ncbi:MAG: helix-turn-helix domain-containing protein [Sphingomicrobium sp.]